MNSGLPEMSERHADVTATNECKDIKTKPEASAVFKWWLAMGAVFYQYNMTMARTIRELTTSTTTVCDWMIEGGLKVMKSSMIDRYIVLV